MKCERCEEEFEPFKASIVPYCSYECQDADDNDFEKLMREADG